MVHPEEILEGLRATCKQSGLFPSHVTYATVELDAESEHANVSLPIIEFNIEDIERNTSRNTEKVGVELDEGGNEIGYVYQGWFDMEITASVITASRGEGNHRSLDRTLRERLSLHDDHRLGEPLPHPDDSDSTLRGINQFQINSSTPNNDFGTSPTMRAREVTLLIGFVHDYYTTNIRGEYEFVEDVEVKNVETNGADVSS